jgi:hypothetical protein
MSAPMGRVLRRTAGRTPTARILGNLPASVPTTPAHLRVRRPVSATARFHTVPALRRKDNKSQTTTGKAPSDEGAASAAGSYARTDKSIAIEYPADDQLSASKPVAGAGRAGAHVFPTLATFSLQGKVGVVTGGARGLGLVMGRRSHNLSGKAHGKGQGANTVSEGMVVSGADLAIVDLNSTLHLLRI